MQGFVQSASDGLTVPAGAVGTARWLLVPRDAAAQVGDVWYEVGGDLTYVSDPQLPAESVLLQPAEVRVSPEGRLAVAYYMERYVRSDNPFTPQTEPSTPAVLATLLTNVGTGPCRSLSMSSMQPQITDNKKGLLVSYGIGSVAVNGVTQQGGGVG
jgi:hypothetical protein